MTNNRKLLASYLQGVGVGLSGGYFTAWWIGDILMYGVAALSVVLVTAGYALDKKVR